MDINFLELKKIIQRALDEDIGTGDITTLLTVSAESVSSARIIAKEDGVVAGLDVAEAVFSMAAKSYGARKREIQITHRFVNGDSIKKDDVIMEISGPTNIILTAERTALNFMQRLSGIATKTAQVASLIIHTSAAIVDTRKTTPGLRLLEKYAVRVGGGGNHRFGLYDAILIKDNHIKAAGGVTQAVNSAKSGSPHTTKIEVEADTIDQVKEALAAGAEMILLDNMCISELKKAVVLCEGRALTEASGGITDANIVEIAETGVDLISIGALTHSVKALDLSLEIE